VQLTVYSLILIAVILWRPTGLIGVLTGAYARITRTKPVRPEEVVVDG
jgi:branched-chain amino acid transport system permease protein